MLLHVVEWLAGTSWSIALHESLCLYPLIESTHVLTLTVFVGLTVMLDLRLLGLAMRQVPASDVIARFVPWAKGGFVIMAISFSSTMVDRPSLSPKLRQFGRGLPRCTAASRVGADVRQRQSDRASSEAFVLCLPETS